MAVLDLSACLRNVVHALGAELVELCKRTALVITSLVCCREEVVILGDHIVFKLSHSLELAAGLLLENLAGLSQCVLRSAFQRLPVLVEERAEHGNRRNLRKRIQECGAEPWQYIKVRAGSLDELEKRTSVNSFSAGEYGVEIILVADYKIQGLESSVTCRVHKVHHLDAVGLDVLYDVFLGEFGRLLLKERHDGVRVHAYYVIHKTIVEI